MTSHSILSLLASGESTTINRLAVQSGMDPRAVRIALVAAAGHGVVEVDETFVNWRLAPQSPSALPVNRPSTHT